MADLTLKRHDTYPPLEAVLEQLNESGGKEPINLTGAVKVLFIMKSGNTVVEGACTVLEATGGKVKYTWVVGDTATPGTWNVEFEIEWKVSPLQVQSVPNESYKTILIEADLGGK